MQFGVDTGNIDTITHCPSTVYTISQQVGFMRTSTKMTSPLPHVGLGCYASSPIIEGEAEGVEGGRGHKCDHRFFSVLILLANDIFFYCNSVTGVLVRDVDEERTRRNVLETS